MRPYIRGAGATATSALENCPVSERMEFSSMQTTKNDTAVYGEAEVHGGLSFQNWVSREHITVGLQAIVIPLGLRITNVSTRDIRLYRPSPEDLIPSFLTQDGKVVLPNLPVIDLQQKPLTEDAYPIIKPSETQTFQINAVIFKRDGTVTLGLHKDAGTGWSFPNLGVGVLKYSLPYSHAWDKVTVYSDTAQTSVELPDIWTGSINPPRINIVVSTE